MLQHKSGEWNKHLKESNADSIWKELHRIVGQHRLSKYSRLNSGLKDEGGKSRYIDLTQELFVKLLEKNRFTYYTDTGMSDKEIELEISQIELTNMITLDLRKRYPESYRMSRRVLTLLQSSSHFKKLREIKHQRTSEQLYGLTEWEEVRMLEAVDIEEAMSTVPYHSRDLRHAGCAGDSQIIISNSDLEDLMVVIFKAVKMPLPVRQVKQLVLSRLTIMDIALTPIESVKPDGDTYEVDLVDTRNSPYQDFTQKYAKLEMDETVSIFLSNLYKRVNQKEKQYTLVLDILKLYYVGQDNLSQYAVSKMLGVSDSTISGYRNIIEMELRSIGLSDLQQGTKFREALSTNLLRL